jgi:diaminopimelate epimerase
MGKPILEPNNIPVDPRHRLALVGRREQVAQWPTTSSTAYFEPEGEIVLDWPVAIPGNNFYITGVSMGNPHAVAFLDSSIDEINLHEIGPQIEHHPLFPNRVNFEVVNIIDRKHLRARVWERGAGATLACGTAACAIAVAARLHGYIDEVVDIDLPGGQIRVSWDGNQEIYMEGPATAVFESQWGA